MHHFGRGLVNTPSNFGQSGDPPTHLELLNYLAEQFIRGGWHMKPITKMIVMSAAYRHRPLTMRRSRASMATTNGIGAIPCDVSKRKPFATVFFQPQGT